MMGKARRYLQDMRVPKDQKAPPSLVGTTGRVSDYRQQA